ncbi:protein SUPPRESSOR OF GENE SILENCING 3 homolog [Aristolochia californica]|uniref:protein SUPPRESSOR OF GENE SILENCING 3 homolog n=1 Tax=Aristolochia californica TaxID=171875 RepID=UPI0035DEB27B
MNSKQGSGKASLAAGASPKQTLSGESGSGNMNAQVNQVNPVLVYPMVGSEDDGGWEVAKKSKNRNINAAAKSRGASSSPPKTGNHQETQPKPSAANNTWKVEASGNIWQKEAQEPRTPAGRGNGNVKSAPSTGKNCEAAYMAPPNAIAPPLQNGWQWAARASNQDQYKAPVDAKNNNDVKSGSFPQDSAGGNYLPNTNQHPLDSESDDDELVEDSDDDILSDDYDSDASQKSHETRKKSKWFITFFEALDNLAVEELSDSQRKWHCPACHDGPGAIEWYKGLQPLMTHAKTKGSQRVRLHRELAELLEQELRLRDTSVVPPNEAFGKWRGLRSSTTDQVIVWPPMVIIRNTLLEKDENEKWIGMGNSELLDYFGEYPAVRARHSYGPQGHRGISALLFEASAVGYHEAERLHKQFHEQGTDRDAWENRRVLFNPGGKRQLYGYMARKEDLDNFNQHSQGKSRLKFEMVSYQEKVVGGMKQMSEENEQLIWLKNKDAERKALKETVGLMSNQLRIAKEENHILRLRTKKQYEESKEEMDNMEKFFNEKIADMLDAREAKEQAFDQALQEDRAAELSNVRSGRSEDHRQEEIEKFINYQEKCVDEFEVEREKIEKSYKAKRTEMKRRHYEEEMELEKGFDDDLNNLIEMFTESAPRPSVPSGSS